MPSYALTFIARPQAAFTRPANTTAYESGDLVANSATAGDVVALAFNAARSKGGTGVIRRAVLSKNGVGVTNAAFRLHLYTTAPVPSNGDNGAWLTTKAGNYLGCIDVTVDKVFADGAAGTGAPAAGAEIRFALPLTSQKVYGLLEARGAYTPASGEVYIVELEIEQQL